MQFNDTFITNVGKTLLARSVAQEGTLIWTSAKTSDADMENFTILQMNNLTNIFASPLDKYTSSGEVTNAIVNDEESTVTMYSELNNRDYDGLARVYGMWAKIEGDGSETLVIVARCGSGVTPTTINPYSVGYEKFFVNCAIEISAEQANAIEVSETNYYASSEALSQEVLERQSLASRVVTCHVSGEAKTGEAQNIYGTKTFNDGLNTTSLMCMSIQSIVFSVIEGVYPSSDNYGDIGSADHPFANVVADIIGYSDSTIYGTVFSNGISPRTTNAYDIGSNNYRYAYVFCSNLDVLTSISCSGNVSCSGDISCSGTVTTNSLAPSAHLGSSIGTPSVYYLDLYAANLHGVIPVPTDESTIPVGSIVVLKDLRNIIGSDRFNPGDLFDCSTSPYQNNIIQCSLSGVVVGVGNELTTGKFKAISYLPDSEQVFLAIKFAD